MKKILLLLISAMPVLMSQAQVLNNNFENLNSDGTVKNWGVGLLIAVQFDTTGHAISDSLVMDNALYFSTTDAHSGARALEMRNAYLYTSGQQLAGEAILTTNDSEYINFSPAVTISNRPTDFTFYYKFYPAATDTGYAWFRIYDYAGAQIGEATMDITGTVNTYTLASVPVTYSTTDSAATIQMGFRAAKPGTSANYGTRFLVDDVNLVSTGINSIDKADNSISFFPNPAKESLNIRLKELAPAKETNIRLTDMYGRKIDNLTYDISGNTVHMDVTHLLPGSYIVTVVTGTHFYSGKFIK